MLSYGIISVYYIKKWRVTLNKFIVLILFSLIFSGCVTSLNNKIQKDSDKISKKRVKLDKNALYIRSNYLLLKKMDINLSSFNEEKITLDYLKNLIHNAYNKKFLVKQKVLKSNNILMFTLTLKDSFWKNEKKSIIKKKCDKSFEDLKKLENYMKNPGVGLGYQYGLIIQNINRICYYIRKGGGSCNIIHNINDLHKLYKKDYEKCVNKYKNDNTFRQTKIIIKLKRKKRGNVNALIIYIVKKRLSDDNTITEKYLVLKNNKKLYILSLNKKSKFSKIFNKKLKFLSYDDLVEIKNILN